MKSYSTHESADQIENHRLIQRQHHPQNQQYDQGFSRDPSFQPQPLNPAMMDQDSSQQLGAPILGVVGIVLTVAGLLNQQIFIFRGDKELKSVFEIFSVEVKNHSIVYFQLVVGILFAIGACNGMLCLMYVRGRVRDLEKTYGQAYQPKGDIVPRWLYIFFNLCLRSTYLFFWYVPFLIFYTVTWVTFGKVVDILGYNGQRAWDVLKVYVGDYEVYVEQFRNFAVAVDGINNFTDRFSYIPGFESVLSSLFQMAGVENVSQVLETVNTAIDQIDSLLEAGEVNGECQVSLCFTFDAYFPFPAQEACICIPLDLQTLQEAGQRVQAFQSYAFFGTVIMVVGMLLVLGLFVKEFQWWKQAREDVSESLSPTLPPAPLYQKRQQGDVQLAYQGRNSQSRHKEGDWGSQEPDYTQSGAYGQQQYGHRY